MPIADRPNFAATLHGLFAKSRTRFGERGAMHRRREVVTSAIGPLFAGPPSAHGIPWLHVLPILVAVPAAALLLWELLHGRLHPIHRAFAVLLPIAVYALCRLLVLKDTKNVWFCRSCHVITPIVASIEADNGSLAAIHYARGLVPQSRPARCAAGYGIWGTVDAKMDGVMHMLRTVAGRIRFSRSSSAARSTSTPASAATPTRRASAPSSLHQSLDIQKAPHHPGRSVARARVIRPAHPDSALTGGKGPS